MAIDRIGTRVGVWVCVGRNGTLRKKPLWVWRCDDCHRERNSVAGNMNPGCSVCRRVKRRAARESQLVRCQRNPCYSSWLKMLRRCNNPKDSQYANYGGRGIKVCERWHKFENFREDMGPTPEKMQIDRIDNNRGYEPGNCRWVTKKQNNANRRISRYVTFRGERRYLADLCAEFGADYYVVHTRLRIGWEIERALTTPVNRQGKNFARNRSAA